MTATTGSITNVTLPGESNTGNIKQTDFPEPVGCTTIASLPAFNAAKRLI